jgi:large subunit ribosomal protein L25
LVLHIDFQRVDAKQKVHVRVPLHFVNAETSPAVKLGGAIVSHIATDLEVSCLPSALPEFIQVDLSKIEVGHSIHAKDIPLPAGVVLVPHLDHENPVIANARVPAGNVEAAAAAAEAAPAEAPKEEKK